MADDFLSMFPPITGDPYGADAYAAMGGLNARDVFSQIQDFRAQQEMASQAAMADFYAQQQPVGPQPVSMDQFVDWPTYQQTVGDKLEGPDAYDEYVNVALPHQLAAMGLSPEEQQQSIVNFTTAVPRPQGAPGIMAELGNELMIGTDIAAQDVRGLAQRFLPDWITSSIDSLGEILGMPSLDEVSKQRLAARTPAMQEALAKEWVVENPETGGVSLGPAWSDWRTYAGGLAQSLPESALAMFPAMRAARAFGLPGAYVTGAAIEGALGGEQAARQVTQEILSLPEDQLQQSAVYQGLLDQGLSPADARQKLASDADTKAFLMAGVTTGMFGGAGDLMLARAIRGAAGGLARRAVTGVVGEGLLEEAPQSGLQQIAQNLAVQPAIPGRATTAGALNQAVGGAVLGSLQGGGQNVLLGRSAPSPPAVADVSAAAVPTPEEELPDVPLPDELSLAAAQQSGVAPPASSPVPTVEPSATPMPDLSRINEEVYARVITEGVRPLLEEAGITSVPAKYSSALDAIEDADDAVAALTTAIDEVQAIPGPQSEPIADTLTAIRDTVQAVEAVDRVNATRGGPGITQESLRRTLNITTASGRRANREAWLTHFDRLNAIRETERHAAELRIMEEERQEMLERAARVGARTQEGGGGVAAVAPISTAAMAEAASVIDDALGAIAPNKQVAIRQRADQLLQETVHAANQRANQRGVAGNTGTQYRPPGGRNLARGSSTGRRGDSVAGLTAEQQRAVAGARTGVGGTVADRVIEKVAAGEADPRILGLLVLADQVTQEIVDARQTETQTPAAEPAPVAEAPKPEPEPVAKPAPKRGLKRATTTTTVPAVPTIGRALLAATAQVPRSSLRRGSATQAVPAGAVRPVGAEEVTPPQRIARRDDTGRGTSNLRRRDESLARLPERAAGTSEDRARLKKQQQVVAALMSKHGYDRNTAWNLVQAEDDDVWMELGWTEVDGGFQPTPQMSPDLIRTIDNGGINEVLEVLKTTQASPLQRAVAGRIQELGLTTPIVIDELPGLMRGKYTIDRIGGDQITLDPLRATNQTVLHEILHAATIAAMRSPVTEVQRTAAKRINELYEYVRAQPRTMRHYGLESVEEFVAETYANPGFQKYLASLPLPGPSKISALTAFKRFVLRLLGVEKTPTVLSEALLTGEDLFDSRKWKSPLSLQENPLKKNASTFASRPSDAIVGVNKAGARRAIAYVRKDGTYAYYDSTDEVPRGVPESKVVGITRQEVEAKMKEAGLSIVAPRADAQARVETPPAATDNKLPGYRDGKLQFLAYKQDDGTWNVYTSDSDNVTTDPQATKVNVPDEAAVRTMLGGGGYRTRTPSAAAKVPQGGGGGSNTVNSTPPAAVTPDGPARDMTYRSPGKTKLGRLRISAQDRFAAIQELGAQLAEQYNGQVPDWMRVDWAATLRNSAAQRRINAMRDAHVKPMQKQAQAMMKKYGKKSEEIENDWIDLHFKERAEHKERRLDPSLAADPNDPYMVQLRDDQARANTNLTELQRKSPQYYADLVRLAQSGKRMSDVITDLRVSYGLLDPAVADRIKGVYQYYVPIQTGDRTTVGKRATGQTAQGTRPFQRLQEQMINTIMLGEKNLIAQRIRDLARTIDVKDEDGKPIFRMGQHAVIGVNPRDSTIGYEADVANPMSPNSVAVFDGGKRMYMEVEDKALLDAMQGFSGLQRQTALTAAIGMASWVNHLSAMGKTAANPGFAVFNLIRDSGVTMIQLPKEYSRGRFLIHLASPEVWRSSFMSAFTDDTLIPGKGARGLYKEVKEAGGLITQQAYMALDPLIADVENTFKPTIGAKLRRGLRHPADTRIGKTLTALSQALESGTRMAIYQTVLEKHLNEGMAPEAAKTRAAVVAKTTTVNFETKGATPIAPLYLFANAKIQGFHTFKRKLVNEKNPYTQAATGALVALGLAAAALGYKDSEKDKDGKSRYGKIPQAKRDSLVLIKEGLPGFPLPQEFAPFYALGNTIGDGIWGDTESQPGRMGARIFRVLAQTFSPLNTPQQDIAGFKSNVSEYLLRSVIPSPGLPAFDIATNRNTFGTQIVPNMEKQQEKGVPLREMYSKNENQLAVNMAKGIHSVSSAVGIPFDVAPAQIKHVATMFDPTASSFWSDLMGAGKPPSYPGQVRNPLVRRFMGTATSFTDDENYKEAKQEVLEAKYFTTNPTALKRGTPSVDTKTLVQLESLFRGVDSQISNLYRDFKGRPQKDDLAVNTRKQELQQQALKEYYRLTGKGGR